MDPMESKYLHMNRGSIFFICNGYLNLLYVRLIIFEDGHNRRESARDALTSESHLLYVDKVKPYRRPQNKCIFPWMYELWGGHTGAVYTNNDCDKLIGQYEQSKRYMFLF